MRRRVRTWLPVSIQMVTLALCTPALGAEWREVRTPHVVLRSDLSPKDAREAAVAVERARERLVVAGWPRATFVQDDTVVATVFSDWSSLPKSMAVPDEDTSDVPVQFVTSGAAEHWAEWSTVGSRLNHVLVHHLAAGIYRHPPPWFVEGLAQLMETVRAGVRAGEDPSTIVVGEPNLAALRRYKQVRSVQVADALRWDGRRRQLYTPTVWGLSGMSYAMVFWLYNVHPEAIQQLLNPRKNPDRAWKELRGVMEAPDIDGTIWRWILYSQASSFHVRVGALPEVPVSESVLTPAEVHATRARVLLHGSRAVDDGAELRSEAVRELTATATIDPRSLTAMLLQLRLDPAAEQRLVQKDWREQNNLALERIEAGKPVDAVAPALHAASLAPFQPAVLDTLASAQAAVGQCLEAQVTQTRAIELLPKGTEPQTLERFRGRLDAYRSHCSGAGGQTGTGRGAGQAPTAPGAGQNAMAPPSPPSGK